ncbi:MAG: copper chaperone PCu(A)C [Hyphomicrobiales bacterium]
MTTYPFTQLTRRRALTLGLKAALAAGLAPAVALSPAQAHEIKFKDLLIVHPWVRQTPANAQVAGGFLKIINKGKEPDRLVSATAEIATSVQIHDMTMNGDVMEMVELPKGVEILPGKTVEFKPKHLHLMLMGLKDQPMPGSVFKGTLTFEKAGTVDIEFEVQEMGKDEPSHGAMQ